jgi:hypothetical protein
MQIPSYRESDNSYHIRYFDIDNDIEFEGLFTETRASVAQHILLSKAAKTLSLAQVFRMTDAEAETAFRVSAGPIPTAPRFARTAVRLMPTKPVARMARCASAARAASRMYVERAYKIAAQYADLFDYNDPADAFAITDDFMSTGRISGAECIPIPQLQVGQFKTINGKGLRVKYKRELEYLTDIL